MKKIILFIFAVIYIFFVVKSTSVLAQNSTYPIASLGNCQNDGECFYYCQIPAHTPACWAYGEYVLKPDVLGTQTISPEEEAKAHGVTFPVAELGNCANPTECFSYCDKPENQTACFSFAKKKNLLKEADANLPPPSEIVTSAKTELGCTSRESCQTLCENPQNIEKCRTFAEKHKLNRSSEKSINQGPSSAEIVQKAQAQLGCSSETECQSFCANPANTPKCLEFAKNNKLLDSHQEQEIKDSEIKKAGMLNDAEKELGCNSMESCSAFCSQTENRSKCEKISQKHNPENENKSKKQSTQSQNTKPCTSDAECKNYCSSHPDECPGFKDKKPDEPKNVTPLPKKSADQTGDFIGPTGCKTEGECQAYCQKHPKECPNMPKVQITPQISPSQNKPDRIISPKSGGNQLPQFTPVTDQEFRKYKINDTIKPSKPPEFENH
ncbi:hypothetical protein HY338_02580 [Candidatus Gottesmanbacteria bacterium]|nr:hypothetical protein [Candidatus Gottesmanbacteria bacterium]